jgi:hypothetical protein
LTLAHTAAAEPMSRIVHGRIQSMASSVILMIILEILDGVLKASSRQVTCVATIS